MTVVAIGVAMSFTSQAYGIFAGSIVELKLSLLFAALLMVYQIIFAGGLVFMKDVNPMWHWMFEVSPFHFILAQFSNILIMLSRSHS